MHPHLCDNGLNGNMSATIGWKNNIFCIYCLSDLGVDCELERPNNTQCWSCASVCQTSLDTVPKMQLCKQYKNLHSSVTPLRPRGNGEGAVADQVGGTNNRGCLNYSLWPTASAALLAICFTKQQIDTSREYKLLTYKPLELLFPIHTVERSWYVVLTLCI